MSRASEDRGALLTDDARSPTTRESRRPSVRRAPAPLEVTSYVRWTARGAAQSCPNVSISLHEHYDDDDDGNDSGDGDGGGGGGGALVARVVDSTPNGAPDGAFAWVPPHDPFFDLAAQAAQRAYYTVAVACTDGSGWAASSGR